MDGRDGYYALPWTVAQDGGLIVSPEHGRAASTRLLGKYCSARKKESSITKRYTPTSGSIDFKLQVRSLLCGLLRDSFKQQLVHQRLRHGFQLRRGWPFFKHALWAHLLRVLFVASGKVCAAPVAARMRHLGLEQIHQSNSIDQSIHPSIHPSVRPSVRPSIHPSIHPSIFNTPF